MIEQNLQYQFALQGQMDTANRLFRTQAELAEARQIIGKLNAELEELKKNGEQHSGVPNGTVQPIGDEL